MGSSLYSLLSNFSKMGWEEEGHVSDTRQLPLPTAVEHENCSKLYDYRNKLNAMIVLSEKEMMLTLIFL